MFRRYLAFSPWKRRTLAMLAGLAIGAAGMTVYQYYRYAGVRDFARAYVEAHRSGDASRLAGFFCWDGVPDAERSRLKLTLKQELDLPLKSVRLDRPASDDGAPRETPQGRRVPNLTPVFRMSLVYGDAQGAGVSAWLVGESPEGYRIVVYRPEPAR